MSTVQSIERAFSILDVIAASEVGISVTETSKRVQLPTSTVSRLIMTLEQLGAVERLENEHVRIGKRIHSLSQSLTEEEKLIRLAKPILKDLATSIGEDAALVVPDQFKARFIAQESGGQVIQVQDWTGSSFAMHSLTAGKLCMAQFNSEELERYFAAFSFKNTSKKALKLLLKDLKQAGLCWSFGDFSEDLNAVSAPIFKAKQVVAALTLYGPNYRFPDTQQEAISERIKRKAEYLSKQLS